jgi:hypothetical protein
VNVPLPAATETYTVISHGSIIQKVENELNIEGLVITGREYRNTYDGSIAKGVVYITDERDPDISIAFTWVNSYNKQVKFGCGIGGLIRDNHSVMLGSEGTSWIRKHTGRADSEAFDIIEQLTQSIGTIFDKLILEKERMKAQPLSNEMYGRIMGAIFFEHNLLTPTQANAVKKEWDKPKHEYSDKDTLWGLYKCLMYGIDTQGDIKKWHVSQQKLHHMIMAEYAIAEMEGQAPIIELTHTVEGPIKTDNISTDQGGEDKEHKPFVSREEGAELRKEARGGIELPGVKEEVIPTESKKEVTPESEDTGFPFNRNSDVSGLFHSSTDSEEEDLTSESETISNDVEATQEEPAVEEVVIEETISNEPVQEVAEPQVEETINNETKVDLTSKEVSAVINTAVGLGYNKEDAEAYLEGFYNSDKTLSENLKGLREWIDAANKVVKESAQEPKIKMVDPKPMEQHVAEYNATHDAFTLWAQQEGHSRELSSFFFEHHYDTNLSFSDNGLAFKDYAPAPKTKKEEPKKETPKVEEKSESEDNLISDMEALTEASATDTNIESAKATLFDVEEVKTEPIVEEAIVEEIVKEEPVVEEKLETTVTAKELEKPVEIMSPEESKAKAVVTEEPVTQELDDNPFPEVEEEVQDILDTPDLNEGLEPSDELLEQVKRIEAEMTDLYGSIRPYNHEEINGYINVIIDESLDRFSIPA